MPITFTKEEIRYFLKEQGYDVADEHTLQQFIHDLKKLIKYEEMKRRRRKLGHHPDDTVLDSTDGRHGHTTTTTTTQDSSSYGEDPYSQEYRNRSRQYQNQKSPRRRPPSSSPAKKSPGRGPPSSPGKKGAASTSYRQPPRQNPPNQQQGGTGNTQSFGTDEGTSSYGYYDDSEEADGGARSKGVRPNQQGKAPVPPSTQRAVAPPKKQGNRLIMKRVTASQGANGDSVIEESDIDLGPARRPLNYRPPKQPVGRGRGRPQTAPAFRRERPETGSSRPGMRPTSARSQTQKDQEDPCDLFEPDELFQALNELIFPNDQIDSKDSLFADSDDKPKNLLRPPPHVAIDPVALYHWYKTYNWDVYSIPGEDRHMKLRWNVRAKTVGGYHPCVEVRKSYKPKPCGC